MVKVYKVSSGPGRLIRHIRCSPSPPAFRVACYELNANYNTRFVYRWVTRSGTKVSRIRPAISQTAAPSSHPVTSERRLRPGLRCLVRFSLLVTSGSVSPMMRVLLKEGGIGISSDPKNRIAFRDAEFLRVPLQHQATLPSEHFYDSILRTLATSYQPFPIRFNQPFIVPNKEGAYRLGFNIASPQLMNVERTMTLGVDEKFTSHKKEGQVTGRNPAIAMTKREYRPALTALKGLSCEVAQNFRDYLDIRLGSGVSGKEMAVGLEVVYQWSALQPTTTGATKTSEIYATTNDTDQERVVKRFMFTKKEAWDEVAEVPSADYWKKVAQKYRQDSDVEMS